MPNENLNLIWNLLRLYDQNYIKIKRRKRLYLSWSLVSALVCGKPKLKHNSRKWTLQQNFFSIQYYFSMNCKNTLLQDLYPVRRCLPCVMKLSCKCSCQYSVLAIRYSKVFLDKCKSFYGFNLINGFTNAVKQTRLKFNVFQHEAFQNPVKDLRWSVLQKQLLAFSW